VSPVGVKSKGLCNAHYKQDRYRGELLPLAYTKRKPADVLARDDQGRKRCSDCGEWQKLTSYYKQNTLDGLAAICKHCYKKRYENTRRDSDLRRKFGISLAERNEMLASQDYRCAACGVEEPGRQDWGVDHDHSCCPGKQTRGDCIRGILCTRCNTVLGMVNDDQEALRGLLAYLGNHPPRNGVDSIKVISEDVA
jgi:hypothetical protein